jgi:hypothetical protein
MATRKQSLTWSDTDNLETTHSREKSMTNNRGNRPAEIFGYHFSDISPEASQARKNHWCPFLERRCIKNSRLIDYPFGVCTVEHGGNFYTICPHRFEEKGTIKDIPLILENIALHYFGNLANLVLFSEIRLPNIGSIDFVLVRHKPMRAEIEDFIPIEFQSDSTTGTGPLVQGLKDFFAGLDILDRTYNFGINTYDTIKRSMTQLFNKGIVYEKWGIKSYWVIQEYIYANLVKRYGLKREGFSEDHASRFALQEFTFDENKIRLQATRFISVSVDEVYQAMRNNPGLPMKDEFVANLNEKLKARLSLKFE